MPLHIRWTPINLASALQCDLSWVEALEAGNAKVPEGLAEWLETLAQCHEKAGVQPPIAAADTTEIEDTSPENE